MSGRMVIMLLGSLLAIGIMMAFPQAATVDWKQLDDTWKQYLANPTADLALQISKLLPENSRIVDLGDGAAVASAIGNDLASLESAVYASDTAAVVLSFRFYAIASGTFLQSLNRIVGNLIHINSRLFLQNLLVYRPLITDLAGILSSYKLDYVDDAVSQEIEKKTRIKALENNEDKELKSIKKECLKILKVL